jgi:hypothetical protein
MQMSAEIKPDMSCLPYRRKGLYFVLTIPFFVVFISVFVYLWTFSFLLSVVFLLLYLGACLFQAYCCTYQDCPYVGGFCPAVAGIMPASIFTKLIYGRRKIKKSKRRFDIHAIIATACGLGLIVFPLPWISKCGFLFGVGYIAFVVAYLLIFFLTICPACAIRHTCPGGKLQSIALKK